MILKTLRYVFRIPPPKVSAEDALRIAEHHCNEKGWGWIEPESISGLREWKVYAHKDIKGGPWVVIDNQTGEVLRSGCPTR